MRLEQTTLALNKRHGGELEALRIMLRDRYCALHYWQNSQLFISRALQ